MLTSQAQRPEHALAASGEEGDHTAGRDSTAVLQVESDRPSAEDVTVPPTGGDEGPGLQIRLDGRVSVPPPTSHDVARLEDVLTIGPKPAGQREVADAPTAGVELPIWVRSRASVPPPEPGQVARLEDVLSVRPAENAPSFAPKTTAAAHQTEARAEVATPAEEVPLDEADPAPAAEVQAPPVEEVQPPATRERQSSDRRYVPAYALRAAFWFEQASAFESSSGGAEDEDVPVAQIEPVQPAAAAPSTPPPLEAALPVPEVQVETPRRHWMLAVCLLALAGLALVITGRRPCRCSCKASR